MTLLWTLVVLLLCVIATGYLIWFLQQRDTARREAIEALAARRGWSLTITSQNLGRPSILRLASRAGPSWQAEVKRYDASSGAKSQNITEYHSTATGWPDNLLVVCPAARPGNEPAAHTATDPAAGDAIPDDIRDVVEQETGGEVSHLYLWPGPDGMAVYATSDPSLRTDLGDLAKVYLDWVPFRRGRRGHPVVVLGGAGLRVRLGHALRRADGLETFMDYATALYRHFSRP